MLGQRGAMLAVWPISEDANHVDYLVAVATGDLAALAAEQGLRILPSHTTTWHVAEPGELPGFEWCQHQLLTATVRPVEVVAEPRLDITSWLAALHAEQHDNVGEAA